MNFEGKPQSLLTFRVGPVLCCAPSLPVQSIITPPKLTHIAGSEAATPGIFKHGSHIVKVLDLRLKFGVDEAQHSHPGNLIVTISEAGNFAFWVDQILDVFDFPKEGWGNLPPAIPRGIFTHTLLLNNKIHLYSEFEKLSSISNLGYLEHYIRQLTENENVKPDANKTEETTALPVIEKTKTHEPASTAATTSTHSPTKVSAWPSSSEEHALTTTTTTHDVSLDKKTVSATVPDTVETSDKTKATTTVTTGNEKSINSTPFSQVPSQEKNDSHRAAARPVSPLFESSPTRTTSQATKPASSISSASSHTLSPSSQTTGLDQAVSTGTHAAVSTGTHAPVSTAVTVPEQPRQQAQTFSSAMNKDDEKDIIKPQKSITAISQSSVDTEYEEDSSSGGIILFFILLLLLPAAGIYYYFSQQTAKPYRYEAEPAITRNEAVINNGNKNTAIQKEKTGLLTKPETVSESNAQAQDITKKENETIKETVTSPASKTEPLVTSGYYADINQNEGEITITIHQPAAKEISTQTETVITPEGKVEAKNELEDSVKEETDNIEDIIKEPIKETLDIEIVPVIETAPVKPLESEEIAKPVAEKKVIKEIVHVVVKGDTLWAIAKKYVKDPFLYPELARLSNIKNPHRIYPGNRVRIRFTNN